MDWIGEDDPVSHSPLSKDYASQRNLRGFLIKITPIKRAAKRQPTVQGEELLLSSFNGDFRQYFGGCLSKIRLAHRP